MKRKLLFRTFTAFLAVLTLSLSTLQCFGGFPLLKTVYKLNKSVSDSGSLGGRFVQELVMIVLTFFLIYPIATFIDLIIFNLIEFWTGKPIMTANQTSPDGRISFRTISPNEMQIDVRSEKGLVSLFVFRDKPGEFYTKSGNDYIRVEVPEELKNFDPKGNTTVSCTNEAATIRCVEGEKTGAWIQKKVNRQEYLRTEALVRAHLVPTTGMAAR